MGVKDGMDRSDIARIKKHIVVCDRKHIPSRRGDGGIQGLTLSDYSLGQVPEVLWKAPLIVLTNLPRVIR
jgi:hypothetical protein